MNARKNGLNLLLCASVAFGATVLCFASAAWTQPAPEASSPGAMAPAAAVPYGYQLIKVNGCHPQANIMQSGGWAGYPGYAAGWGYRGAYYGDPYGLTYYQNPVTTADPQLGIDYVNISPKTMNAIIFGLVVNGELRAQVRDEGTFSPGVEIKHKFGISINVFPLQSGLPQCVALGIQFSDGSKWRNPKLPPKNKELYGPVGFMQSMGLTQRPAARNQ